MCLSAAVSIKQSGGQSYMACLVRRTRPALHKDALYVSGGGGFGDNRAPHGNMARSTPYKEHCISDASGMSAAERWFVLSLRGRRYVESAASPQTDTKARPIVPLKSGVRDVRCPCRHL